MSLATASPIVSDREWNAHILAQLAAGKLTQEDALAQLKTAPKSAGNSLSCKVSEKGAGSLCTGCMHARHALCRAVGALAGLRGPYPRVHRPVQRQAGAEVAELGRRVDSPTLPLVARSAAGEWVVLLARSGGMSNDHASSQSLRIEERLSVACPMLDSLGHPCA